MSPMMYSPSVLPVEFEALVYAINVSLTNSTVYSVVFRYLHLCER